VIDKKQWSLQPGRCYVGGGSGATIRRIESVSMKDDRVHYAEFGTHDGGSIGDSFCQIDTFYRWAKRAATEEEVARLHTSTEHLERQDKMMQGMSEHLAEYARKSLKEPRTITDEMLIDEVLRRGLQRDRRLR
jgi:hypothetical protein